MSFWIFMTVMNLLIPLAMIVIGYIFRIRAPKKINMLYGYRTSMSMKNKDTWVFAHLYCGKIWIITGWILLAATIPAMLYAMNKSVAYVSIYGLAVCVIQMAVMMFPIIPTEIALSKTFHDDGTRKTRK